MSESLNTYNLTKTQSYIVQQYNLAANEPWCYHTQFSYHIQIKDLSWPFLFKAVKGVLDRHPVFKTVMLFEEEAKQAINTELNLQTQFLDISHLASHDQTEWIDKFLLDDRNRPFEIYNKNQPLCRSYIIKRGSDSFQFILVIMHAIWDGWSLALLIKEIFAYYQDLKKNPSLVLSPASYEYEEFIASDESRYNDTKAKEFWKRHLLRHQPYSRIAKGSEINYNDYWPVTRKLPIKLTTTLQFMQPKLRATVKSIFVSLFIRMITEETGLSNATIGMVSNGRGSELSNPLGTLGLLWSIAPLCAEVIVDDLQHIKNTNKLLSEISPFCSYPLLKIQEEKGDSNLLHATFNFINFDGTNLLPPDSNIEFLEVGGLDKFSLPLHLLVAKNPFNKEISLVLNYDTRYFSKSEIEEKLDVYVKRLEQVIYLEV
jgi:surfactin family lipopeptide synthetase C